MLQDTWRSKMRWDDVIPLNIHEKLINWLQLFKSIGSLRLPRYYQTIARVSEKDEPPSASAPHSAEQYPVHTSPLAPPVLTQTERGPCN